MHHVKYRIMKKENKENFWYYTMIFLAIVLIVYGLTKSCTHFNL